MAEFIGAKFITPQHIRTYFTDATPQFPPQTNVGPPPNKGMTGKTNILTIYTGLVGIDHIVPEDEVRATEFFMPVLGLFPPLSAPAKGIFPFTRPLTSKPAELIGATAMIAHTAFVALNSGAICRFEAASADLMSVVLSSGQSIFAVVLHAIVAGQKSEVRGFQYQVTVLSRIVFDPSTNPKDPQPVLQPITVGQTWDGDITSCSRLPSPLGFGQPQPL
jgi:hypothetical protein